jgi:hypothetical protein
VQYRGLSNSALDVFEPQLLQTVRTIATDNASVPYDAPLRRVEEIGQDGLKIVKFIGQRCFTRDFAAPIRYVIGFRTPQGLMNTRGRFVGAR